MPCLANDMTPGRLEALDQVPLPSPISANVLQQCDGYMGVGAELSGVDVHRSTSYKWFDHGGEYTAAIRGNPPKNVSIGS